MTYGRSHYHFAESRPSLGETLGSSLGTGLGRSLTAFAETKLDNMLKRQRQGQLTSQLVKMGIPEDQASYLSQQDPETQWQTVRQWWMSQGYDSADLPESVHQSWNPYESPLSALGQAEQPTQAGPQQGAMAALQNQEREQQAAQGGAMAALAPQAPIVPEAKPAPIPPMPKQRKARDLGEAFKMAEETTPKGPKEKKISDAATKRSEIAIDTADQMEGIANEMLALINTGKVYTGFKGRFVPAELQSDETQQFEALSNELASLLASRSGVATNFKIKLAQSMKPNIRQSTKTQKKLAEKIIETSQDLRNKAQERIGASTAAKKEIIPKQATPKNNLFESLPNAAQYKGKRILDEATGEILVSDGTNWVKG